MLKKSADYPLIMVHAVRHVGLALEGAAPAALSFADLAKGYNHLNSGDLTRVRNIEGAGDNRAAEAWIIRYAVSTLSGIVVDNGMVSFAPGKGFDDLTYAAGKDRQKVEREQPGPHALLHDAFSPVHGIFAENIREDIGDIDELRESMRSWGWIPEFPALLDERGVVLVGNRRMKVAKELGIAPVTRVLKLGFGDAADAERFKLAIASNLGAKKLSPNDRKRIAMHLYVDHDWRMDRIATALNVATKTVSRDLEGFDMMSKPPRPKGGRPRKENHNKTVIEKALSRTGITPEQETQVAELTDAGWTKPQIAEKLGIGKGQVENSRQRHIGRTIQSALLADNPVSAIEDHLCTCLACGNRHNRS